MSSTTRIILIRHGESEGNAENRFGGHLPMGLSLQGRLEAIETAKALAQEEIHAIYSSDLLRAVETAIPLAELKNIPIIETSAFRERNVGVLQGLLFKEAAEKFPKDYNALLQRDFDYVIREGESYRQVLKRAAGELERILKIHRGQSVAIFAHTGTIGVMTLYLLGALNGLKLKPVWIATANCSITRFSIREDGFIVLKSLNNTSHLVSLNGYTESYGFGYKT
jgi:broad specificity phosphatase PhoE